MSLLEPNFYPLIYFFGFGLCFFVQIVVLYRLSDEQEGAINKHVTSCMGWKILCVVVPIFARAFKGPIFTLPEALIESLIYLSIGGYVWISVKQWRSLCTLELPGKSRRVLLITEILMSAFTGLLIYMMI